MLKQNMNFPERWKMFHFIGFNALNECEKAIMTRLKKEAGKHAFTGIMIIPISNPGKLNSAGFFMKENLKNLRK